MTTAIDVDNLVIHNGKHESPENGHCIMEVVSMLAGEPWSDSPACVCPVLASFARRLNDAYGSDDEGRTAALRPFVRRLMGTRGSRTLMERRMFAAADAAVRIFAPLALDATKRPALATKLRESDPVTDADSARRARDLAQEVRASASASASAYAASASAYAASASAYAAAADAAADAAAYAASASSAYGAAGRNARREALAPGITLLHQLCEMKDEEVAT